MTATLKFQTTKTRYGLLHTMRIDGGTTTLTQGAEYRLFPSRPQGVAWVGPVYTAANGSQWRIGRCNSKALIAWKTVKITKRFGQEQYRMRSAPGGYKGDYVKCWSRNINGKTYDFSRVYWNAGQDGWQLTVRRLGQDIHQWKSTKPVTMK